MALEVNPAGRVSITLGEDGVAQVRLIRADKMNALDPDMFGPKRLTSATRRRRCCSRWTSR